MAMFVGAAAKDDVVEADAWRLAKDDVVEEENDERRFWVDILNCRLFKKESVTTVFCALVSFASLAEKKRKKKKKECEENVSVIN